MLAIVLILLGSDRSYMGRSILTVLLATILTISRVSNNPTSTACQSLFILFAIQHGWRS